MATDWGGAELVMADCGGGWDHGGGIVSGPPDVDIGGGTPIMGMDRELGILTGGGWTGAVGGGPTMVGGGRMAVIPGGGPAVDGGGCCHVEIGGCWYTYKT